jgi:hypothetical protein
MSDLDKQVHAVRAAYDDAPPYRDLEAAAVLRAAVQQVLPKDDPTDRPFERVIAKEFLAIADKLEEDHDDY